MDPTNAEYRQALEYMEGTDDTAYRPGGGSFGTLCGGNPCMSLCCLWALCNGGGYWILLLRDHKRGSRDHMIKSMTGYGRARQELHKRDITVEVRSVNNRYLDCTVKMPRMYAFAEDAVKKHVQQAVSRGKVDVFITVDATAADVVKVAVNRELAAQYAAALGELSDVCGTSGLSARAGDAGRFPDVLTVTKADEDLETVSADLCAVLDEALAAYNDMRAVEGQKLAEDISNRLDAIERYTGQVEMRSPETVAEYRAKLTARMEEVLQSTTVDEQRS